MYCTFIVISSSSYCWCCLNSFGHICVCCLWQEFEMQLWNSSLEDIWMLKALVMYGNTYLRTMCGQKGASDLGFFDAETKWRWLHGKPTTWQFCEVCFKSTSLSYVSFDNVWFNVICWGWLLKWKTGGDWHSACTEYTSCTVNQRSRWFGNTVTCPTSVPEVQGSKPVIGICVLRTETTKLYSI